MILRVRSPFNQPGDHEDAHNLSDDQNIGERFMISTRIDCPDQEDRQTDLSTEYRQHVTPDDAERSQLVFKPLQLWKQLRDHPCGHEEIDKPHGSQMPFFQHPELSSGIDLRRDCVPTQTEKDPRRRA